MGRGARGSRGFSRYPILTSKVGASAGRIKGICLPHSSLSIVLVQMSHLESSTQLAQLIWDIVQSQKRQK